MDPSRTPYDRSVGGAIGLARSLWPRDVTKPPTTADRGAAHARAPRPLRAQLSGGRRSSARFLGVLAPVAIVILLAMVLPAGTSARSITSPLGPPVGRSPILAPLGIAGTSSGAPPIVSGTLRGVEPSGAAGPLLGGVIVDLAPTPCPGWDQCVPVAETTTVANGSWSFFASTGNFLLYTNRTAKFGGAEQPLNVTPAGATSISLLAQPYVAYGNASFVLPAWNNLSAYAANCNLALPCKTGSPSAPYGTQVPITSWTQDGVFYVNASMELVYYSLANQTVRPIAAWNPLYDNLMDYDGIEDTEWITADGSYIYEFGCPTICGPSSSVVFYAVNVTTGRTFLTTLSGLSENSFAYNAQVDMIGESGNLSIASIIDASGRDVGYNLWNGTQWNLAILPFFEANNIYWVPGLQSYFDVQAGGSFGNSLVQLRLEGTSPGTGLVQVASTTFAHHYKTNGVGGLVFNATGRTLTFSVANTTGTAITDEYAVLDNGTLGGLVHSWGTNNSSYGAYPSTAAYPNVESSEHRPTMVSNGPAFAGSWNNWYDNDSWLVDPATGTWFDTNLPFDHPQGVLTTYHQARLSPASVEGLFLNSTYALVPWSYDCRTTGSSCPILGTANGSTEPGTVWWTWRLGAPEFPYAVNQSLAESLAPSEPTGIQASVSTRSISLTWTPPTEGANPLINYTLFYGTGAHRLDDSRSIAPQATSVLIDGLASGVTYYFVLEAWNLHWHSAGVAGSATPALLTGFLNLTVTPSTSTVTVDGRPFLPTGEGREVLIPTGNHTVSVSAVGYSTYSTEIFVVESAVTTLEVALTPILPVLEGVVNPASATVRLNSGDLPVSTDGSYRVVLSPGSYTLTAVATGYIPFGPQSFTLVLGQTRWMNIELSRMFGWLDGNVTPANATVSLGSSAVPTVGGAFNLSLSPGLYSLSAVAAGYWGALVSSINVSAGRVTTESIQMVPLTGIWVFSIVPSNAILTLDARPVPLENGTAQVALSAGPHGYGVSLTGYDPVEGTATVEPNTTQVIAVDLNRTVGWLLGSVTPSTAVLTLDGQPVQASSAGGFNATVPVGTHELVASAPGFSSVALAVSVGPHQATTVSVVLAPAQVGAGLVDGSPLAWALAITIAIAAVFAVAAILWVRPSRPGPPR
jgi:hypothetical protein